MYVDHAGESGPVVLLVHGSIAPGWQTWEAQRPLADAYRLIVPHRSGYPPNAPLDRIDFEVQAVEIAELIAPGTHVVGHSYGGIVTLFAAALVPDRIASLTVIEPPAFGLVRTDPAVVGIMEQLIPIFADPNQTPREFVERFAPVAGATPVLPDPLPPALEASIRATMRERPPWEAVIPLDVLATTRFPKLVFSGDHSAAFDAVCDMIGTRLAAERVVILGRKHSVQRTGEPFNRRLRAFIDAA
jgi:pimeloyl-ACP methyl ester carboxylesterase